MTDELNLPGDMLNECIADLGDDEPFIASKDEDGLWSVRTLSGWQVLTQPNGCPMKCRFAGPGRFPRWC